MPKFSAPSMLADLGATNARFALLNGTSIDAIEVLKVSDYPSLGTAIGAYLDRVQPTKPPRKAALAIACPVHEDRVEMTNHAWSFSKSALQEQLALDRLTLINDFAAVALGVPHLDPVDYRQIGGGQAEPNQTVGVVGPGTGLGVSALVPGRERWTALDAEGGHVTMPALTDREAAVIGKLRQRFSHVSAERVLSGMGLTNLYETLASLDGVDIRAREPHEVTEGAMSDADPYCREAVDMFCAMLGTIAGNLALTLGAFGGIYIAGGIAPKMGPLFLQSDFRERFEAKGRFRQYLSGIPTFLVTQPFPALVGLKAALDRPD
ncbi:MAG: glucokinase [Pseudomonadota bacterium]